MAYYALLCIVVSFYILRLKSFVRNGDDVNLSVNKEKYVLMKTGGKSQKEIDTDNFFEELEKGAEDSAGQAHKKYEEGNDLLLEVGISNN